jgi:tetratricopeptide (TPR) repeat protein
MKKMSVFLLFVTSCGWAQLPRTPWSWQPGATPAQSDWVEQVLNPSPPYPTHTDPGSPSEPSVTLTRLSHKPPQKAVKFFLRGVRQARAGKWQDGVNDFERATVLDPQFSEAQGNLGTSLVALGRFEEALGHFHRAIELDPATWAHHLNLAYSLVRLGRASEAEPEARKAVTLQPTNVNAHYLLGILFAEHKESRAAAIQHLAYAGRELPEAHYALAQVYRADGNAPKAKQEMDQYHKQLEQEQETR